MSAAAKQKRQPKQELIKREKDGLKVWDDIPRFARQGHESISEDDHERLKWFGIYGQRPKGCGYFMLRIKIPGGRLTSERLREIGRMCRQYARNVGDISTRQAIQLHWIRIEDVPDILDRIYNKLGMYQQFSCGDAPRNTVGCPLAGVADDEILDARPFVQAVADMYKEGGEEFSNLPRKFKTGISGCRIHCHEPQIQCAALFGVQRSAGGRIERGFGMVVGGGLRDTPHFAQSLRVFIPPDEKLICEVFRATAQIFRDCEELRYGRLRARLKFYVGRVGWQEFRKELEQRLGYELEHDESIVYPQGAGHQDHMGVGRQKDGLCYVGVPIERGRLSGDSMLRLADLAEEYCGNNDARLVTTLKQNIVLLNIDPARVEELVGALNEAGLSPRAHPLRTALLSCTGIEFCKLAVVETKQRAKEILEYLEANVEIDEPLFISVTGCPNSCAQYQIADIGLHGVPVSYQGRKVDGYFMLLGGVVGNDPQFARFVTDADDKKIKIPSPLIHLAIQRVIEAYKCERQPGQTFAGWANAQPMGRLAEIVTPPELREGVRQEAGTTQ